MNTHARRFLLIGFTALIGLWAIIPPKDKLKFGIDLTGGTILVYEVKTGTNANLNMDDLITALKKRVNPDGVLDIPIRPVGSNRIEIILPKAAAGEVDEIKRKMTDVGSLEFRILASEQKDRVSKSLGLTSQTKGYGWARLGESITGEKPTISANKLTDTSQSWVRNRYSAPAVVNLVGKTPKGDTKSIAVTILNNDGNSLTLDTKRAILLQNQGDPDRPRYTDIGPLDRYFSTIDSYSLDYNPGRLRGDGLVIREQPRGKGFLERYVLYKLDRQNVTGKDLSSIFPTQDERVQPAVGFHFNPQGGRRFGTLTGDNIPEEGGAFQRHLAILLDGQLMSAPVIRQQISDQGIIENMPNREVDRLITILRAGSLPATITPTPLLEEQVGATLGADTIEKGFLAIGISMFVVPLFMLVYYRFAGFVSIIALVLNMLLLFAAMAIFQASITLPGLAGLALTIGMAVDANVLIFERMREEKERGASMAQQIRNGFSRAWTTIIDSNVTTILSGMVLYAIGTEEVKGFALTLIIGLLINMFTAVYVSRVIFDFWYSQGWLKNLTMMKMRLPQNIDFVRPRKICMTASVIVITAGVLYSAVRWNSMLNIDFTGGTLVTIQLDPTAPALKGLDATGRTALVRKLASQTLPDAAVESLRLGNEAAGYRFNIRTTEESKVEKDATGAIARNQVEAKVLKKFDTLLARLEMKVGQPSATTVAATPETPKEGEKPKPEEPAKPTSWTYILTFNRPVEPAAIGPKFTDILKQNKIAAPSGMRVDRPIRPNGEAALPLTQVEVKTDLPPDRAGPLFDKIRLALGDDPSFLFERVEMFGGAVAKDTRASAIIAIVASWIIMVAYLWFRFKSVTYGLAAVIALIHDVLITLGAVAISPYKIDLPMIAAFLTLIGFSVNDTIVIFDRIREIKGKTPVLTSKMVNDALNQTLSRTILTSLTAWLVVVIMWIAGGEGLEGFSFCLVVGFLSGTYSTIFIATPVLVDWMGKDTGTPTPTPRDKEMALSR